MKNAILGFAIALLMLNGSASAQVLTHLNSDTATGNYTGGGSVGVYNYLRSPTSTPVTLRWNVIQTDLGKPGWPDIGSGVCDNLYCRTATSGSNIFQNHAMQTSSAYTSGDSINLAHDFHVVFLADNPAVGSSAYVRTQITDLNNTASTRTLTFIVNATPTGITNVSSFDEVVLYPNPARDAINVIYDAQAGIKMIAVYNMIGKLMGPIYKPSSNGSAKIEIDDMPTGIYFLRLMDAQGHVVATRRFTHQ